MLSEKQISLIDPDSRSMLSLDKGIGVVVENLVVKQRKPGHRSFPILTGAAQFGNDVTQRQPDRLELGLVAWGMAARR
jgi:hypothetical protein